MAAAVIAQLGPALAQLAEAPDGWMDSRRAAEYLGLSVDALHKLTAADALPFSQEAPGSKCWFRRSDLDAWRLEGARGGPAMSGARL